MTIRTFIHSLMTQVSVTKIMRMHLEYLREEKSLFCPFRQNSLYFLYFMTSQLLKSLPHHVFYLLRHSQPFPPLWSEFNFRWTICQFSQNLYVLHIFRHLNFANLTHRTKVRSIQLTFVFKSSYALMQYSLLQLFIYERLLAYSQTLITNLFIVFKLFLSASFAC